MKSFKIYNNAGKHIDTVMADRIATDSNSNTRNFLIINKTDNNEERAVALIPQDWYVVMIAE